MIAFIKGTLHKKTDTEVIIETGGIGYAVFVSSYTLSQIGAAGGSVMLHTYMKAGEDGVFLFGFLAEDELKMFYSLISVNGIGPKNAMQILSYHRPDKIMAAVLTDDAKTLSEAPGVGKKTAARIILDLKDKFNAADLLPAGITPQQTFEMSGTAINDAIDALMALGYSHAESAKAVSAAADDGLSSQQIIKLALKQLASL